MNIQEVMQKSDEFRIGKILSQDERACEFLTPVCRASFPVIVNPEQYNGTGPYRFTLNTIFNIKDPSEPAHVDLVTLILPTIAEIARANRLDLSRVNPISRGQKLDTEGNPVAGYEDRTAWCTFAKYPKPGKSFVPCYSPTGQPLDAEAILGGYYIRVRGQAYKPKDWPTISLGLISVQLLAEGPTFGGEPTDTGFDAVPGATEPQTGFDAPTPGPNPDTSAATPGPGPNPDTSVATPVPTFGEFR